MKIDKSTMNVNKTQALFVETNGWKWDNAIYSLTADKEHEGRTIPWIRRLYVEMEDVHEYEFATKYFLGWAHWQNLCDSPIIGPHIKEWREELEVKLRSRAMRQMQELADSGDKSAVKYMADKGWSDAPKTKRGRPSKEEVEGELKQQAAIKKRTAEDLARLRVVK